MHLKGELTHSSSSLVQLLPDLSPGGLAAWNTDIQLLGCDLVYDLCPGDCQGKLGLKMEVARKPCSKDECSDWHRGNRWRTEKTKQEGSAGTRQNGGLGGGE